jgi:hypothetical protein
MKKICIFSLLIALLILFIFRVSGETSLFNDSYEYPQIAKGTASIKSSNENTTETNNETNKTIPLIEKIELLDIIPKNFNIGDAQFNIRIQNNHAEALNNLVPIISGKGFSAYEVIPIDSIKPGEKDYLIISGNFKESGAITLTIKISEEIFYQDVFVENPDEKINTEEENEKKEVLSNLSSQLLDLKQKYSQLESEYFDKKDNDYDLSKVNIDDLKSYIRNIEMDIFNEDIKNSIAKISIAYESYEDQKKKLENSKQKSSISKLKEYSLIFSTIAGAFITLFALSELLKNKSKKVVVTFRKVGSGIIRTKKR